jgi:hypothetical protein
MRRQTVIKTVRDFPSEFDLEELLEKLIFIERVEKGLEQAKKGETIRHEKVVKRFQKKWSK